MIQCAEGYRSSARRAATSPSKSPSTTHIPSPSRTPTKSPISHSPTPSPVPAACTSPTNITTKLTFYGAKDNCPPGAELMYTNGPHHGVAGGTGTYSDPITFAGSPAAFAVGAVVYSFGLQKYFVFEDFCQECQGNWVNSDAWHLDLWIGPTTVVSGPGLIECEDALTQNGAAVEICASPNHPVNPMPLFDGTTSTCIVPVETCVDNGNVCGNECQIPYNNTCSGLATMFGLSLARFEALNPTIPCNATLPINTSVCMGGSCGD